MPETFAEECIRTLTKRGHLMERIVTGPTDRRDLVEEVEESRATVYRGLDQLAERGLVTERAGTYRPTSLGRLVFDQYRRCRDVVSSLHAADDVLQSVPADELPDPELFLTADVTLPHRHAPMRLVDRIVATLEGASEFSVLSPVVRPRILRTCHRLLEDENASARFVFESPAATYLRTEYPEFAARFESEATLLETDQRLPFGLVVTGDPAEQVCINGYSTTGELVGVVQSDAEPALDWALSVYEKYCSIATRPSAVNRDDSVLSPDDCQSSV